MARVSMTDDLDALQRRQDQSFGASTPTIANARAAERFLARVGVALRYGPTRTFARLPKAAAVFKRIASPGELQSALHRLAEARRVRLAGSGRNLVAVYLGRHRGR